MTKPGAFILLEGPDGGGKTTVGRRVAAELERRGVRVVSVREPGGTAVGEKIRRALLEPDSGDLSPETETLLFYAARAQLIREVISPALARGEVVIADRYELSTWVYQSWAGGLPIDDARRIGEIATRGLTPDLCIVLDVPTDIGLSRKSGDGSLDRMELKDIAYRKKLREGYLALAKTVNYPCVVIDASQSPDAVFNAVILEIDYVLG